jgi:ketosteroid isomerase-like protein
VETLSAEATALRSRAAAWESCILRRDTTGALQFTTDDFTVVILQPVRAVVQRQQWLRTIGDYRIRDYQTEDEVVEVDGDLGIVMQRIRQLATVLGQDRSGVFIHTDIWRRHDGEWRVWRRHSTPLTAGPYPSAPG